jgi:hypothetical protein
MGQLQEFMVEVEEVLKVIILLQLKEQPVDQEEVELDLQHQLQMLLQEQSTQEAEVVEDQVVEHQEVELLEDQVEY